jgi:lipopolysaccharide/colanic/teichoic acid biosynthesis glycosyltransferase
MTKQLAKAPVREGRASSPARPGRPGSAVARLPRAIDGRWTVRARAVLYGRLRKAVWRGTIQSALVVKRILDVVGSLALMVALSPVFVAIPLLIKLEDRGPVLFWQTRVGRWGKPFPFPKFRSMVVDAEARKRELLENNDHGESVTFKMKRDPRITRVGAVLRRTSLDELPQLWSVFKGDMSLVGPRPPVPSEVELYTLADRRRLDVRPGITCLWQVSGRGDIPFPEQVRMDVHYIEHRGFWTDVRLLLWTVPAVLLGKGAY